MTGPAPARVRDVDWVAVDLEMTGLDPARDRICEIGVVRGRGGEVVDRWSTLVDPRVPVPEVARKVHGLDAAALAGAPTFDAVADEVLARLDAPLRVAHHVGMDRAFLEAALDRCGRTLPAACWVDTLSIARRLFVLPRHRLGDVCLALDVPLPTAHRALDDATATLALFQRMLEVLDGEGTLTLAALCLLVDDLAPGSSFRDDQARTLREAAADHRVVRVTYVSRDDDGLLRLTVREVEVWKVSGQKVEGWCRLRGDRRIFRTDRMLRVEVTDARYEVPVHQARI